MTTEAIHKKNTPVIVEVGPGAFMKGFYIKPGRMGNHFVASKKSGSAGWWVSDNRIRARSK